MYVDERYLPWSRQQENNPFLAQYPSANFIPNFPEDPLIAQKLPHPGSTSSAGVTMPQNKGLEALQRMFTELVGQLESA